MDVTSLEAPAQRPCHVHASSVDASSVDASSVDASTSHVHSSGGGISAVRPATAVCAAAAVSATVGTAVRAAVRASPGHVGATSAIDVHFGNQLVSQGLNKMVLAK